MHSAYYKLLLKSLDSRLNEPVWSLLAMFTQESTDPSNSHLHEEN